MILAIHVAIDVLLNVRLGLCFVRIVGVRQTKAFKKDGVQNPYESAQDRTEDLLCS